MPTYSPSSASQQVTVQAKVYATILTLSIPASITEETDFTVSGTLIYLKGTTPTPLAGRGVTLAILDSQGTTLSTLPVTTDANGAYSATLNIAISGTYTITANFLGSSELAPSSAYANTLIGQEQNVAPLALLVLGGVILFIWLG